MRASSVLYKTGDMPYTPAAFVLQGLANFNKGIRLRWSSEEEKWAVEVKAKRAIHTSMVNDRAKYLHTASGQIVMRDAWICQRDGYHLIGYWNPLPHLADWCISELQRNSFERMGGWKAVDRMLMEQEEAVRVQKRRQRETENYAAGIEMYHDMLNIMGSVAYVPRTATGVGE